MTEIIRDGAREVIVQAVEAELATLPAAFADHKPGDGGAKLVRHRHVPKREVMTGIDPCR